MNTIQNEYTKRHNIEYLCPITEAVLFFERNKKPHSICLISSKNKGLKTCDKCNSTSDFILEWFTIEKFPRLYLDVNHRHISPDINLFEFFKEIIPSDCVPYVSKGERDQEMWVWKAITSLERFVGNPSAMHMLRKAHVLTEKNKHWLAGVMYVVQNSQEVFTALYDEYSKCLINRKYLMTFVE